MAVLDGAASFRFPDADGKEYRLVLNNRVLMEAEDVLGYSALDAAEEAKAALAIGRNPMLRTVVALFYGALIQNHREVTQDEAIDMFLDSGGVASEAFKSILKGTDVPDLAGNGAAAARPARKKSGGAGKVSTSNGGATVLRKRNIS